MMSCLGLNVADLLFIKTVVGCCYYAFLLLTRRFILLAAIL